MGFRDILIKQKFLQPLLSLLLLLFLLFLLLLLLLFLLLLFATKQKILAIKPFVNKN